MNKALSTASIQVLLIISAGCIAYLNTFHVPFIFDDHQIIVENSSINSLNNFLSSTHWSSPAFKARWLAMATFCFNKSFGGFNVTGYHVANLTIHLSTSLVLYFLTKNILDTFGETPASRYALAPLVAALFFVLHPVHTQSVTYITQRMASLATLLYLATFLLYSKTFSASLTHVRSKLRRAVLYTTAVIFCVLAMSTKEISFTLPLALTLFDISFLAGSVRQRLVRLLPFFLCLLLMLLFIYGNWGGLVSHINAGGGGANSTHIPHKEYLITECRVLVTYLRLLILPVGLNLDYDYPVYVSLFQPQIAASVTLLAALFVTACLLLKKSLNHVGEAFVTVILRFSGYAIIWFFVTLSVESGAVPLLDVIFEHRLYLPSVGFCMALGVLLVETCHCLDTQKSIVICAVTVLIAVLGVTTYLRNEVWRNPVSLWQDVITKSPNKDRGWANLGLCYVDMLDSSAAMKALEHATTINPENYRALFGLGRAYKQQGDNERALALYRHITQIAPDYANGWEFAGRILVGTANFTEGAFYLKRALELNPDNFSSHDYLQHALNMSKQQRAM